MKHFVTEIPITRESCSFLPDSLWPHGLYGPWSSSGWNTGVHSFSLLQGIFPTHGLNPGLPHCRGIFTSWVSASASVLPMNTEDWSPLGWTGWISLQSKGLTLKSPAPQFKSISSSALSFLYSPTLTSIHDYWKNHSLD